jgi:hypothetical protein
MNLTECPQWQVDFILTLFDDDGNGKLDLQEVTNNYRLIIKELVRFNDSIRQPAPMNAEKMPLDEIIKNKVFAKIENSIMAEKIKRQKKLDRQKRQANEKTGEGDPSDSGLHC